jgi:hypothetical protein
VWMILSLFRTCLLATFHESERENVRVFGAPRAVNATPAELLALFRCDEWLPLLYAKKRPPPAEHKRNPRTPAPLFWPEEMMMIAFKPAEIRKCSFLSLLHVSHECKKKKLARASNARQTARLL